MKHVTLIISIIFCVSAQAQDVFKLNEILNPDNSKNVQVHSLCSDKFESSYLIWVVDSVKPHYHAKHTELIHVIEGKGNFYIGDKKYAIEPGDYIRIPQGKIHSFKTTSREEVKVLSVQTPEFVGKDRIWVTKQE